LVSKTPAAKAPFFLGPTTLRVDRPFPIGQVLLRRPRQAFCSSPILLGQDKKISPRPLASRARATSRIHLSRPLLQRRSLPCAYCFPATFFPRNLRSDRFWSQMPFPRGAIVAPFAIFYLFETKTLFFTKGSFLIPCSASFVGFFAGHKFKLLFTLSFKGSVPPARRSSLPFPSRTSFLLGRLDCSFFFLSRLI